MFSENEVVLTLISGKLVDALIVEKKHTYVEMFGQVVLDKNFYKLQTDVYNFLIMRKEEEIIKKPKE